MNSQENSILRMLRNQRPDAAAQWAAGWGDKTLDSIALLGWGRQYGLQKQMYALRLYFADGQY